MRSKEERTTQCHHCGKSCYNSGYKVIHCSLACKAETDEKKSVLVTEPCVVCGTSVTKRRYLARPVKATCCSNACQKQWSMVANRGQGQTGKIDWIARSKKAKEKYYKKASRQRFEKSEYKKWMQLINDRDRAEDIRDEWSTKCATAAQTLSQRLTHSKKQKNSTHKDFADLCRCSLNRLRNSGYCTLKEWEKKCYSTCKNMKWKRRLRNVRKNTLNRTDDVVQQLKQLSIWEFLETQRQDN